MTMTPEERTNWNLQCYGIAAEETLDHFYGAVWNDAIGGPMSGPCNATDSDFYAAQILSDTQEMMGNGERALTATEANKVRQMLNRTKRVLFEAHRLRREHEDALRAESPHGLEGA